MNSTKPVVHLLVTTLCDRNCKYCCNKQYDVNKIPYVTDEELKNTDTVCLTGGEPFEYSNPNAIAWWLKKYYPNIKNVYVYTNMVELGDYLNDFRNNEYLGGLDQIDGLSVSIKTELDLGDFEVYVDYLSDYPNLTSNLLYVFDGLYPEDTGNFKVIERKWQKEFEPADNSIFRRI